MHVRHVIRFTRRPIWMLAILGSALVGPTAYAGYGQGNTFNTPVQVAARFCVNGTIGSADLNNDRHADVYCQESDGSVDALITIKPPAPQSNLLTTPVTGVHVAALGAGFCPVGDTLGTADLNGDGFLDFYCHETTGSPNSHNNTYAALNSRSTVVNSVSFGARTTWMSNWCALDLRVARYDANATDDFLCYDENSAGGSVSISTSSASGANTSQPVVNSFCPRGDLFGTADLKGRGQKDLWCHDPTTGNVTVRLAPASGQSGYQPVTTWLTSFCATSTSGTAAFGFGLNDVDGDGKADAWCWDPSKNIDVALNSGTSLVSKGSWLLNWCSDFASGHILNDVGSVAGSSDFNGDARFDLVCWDKTTGGVHVALSDAPGNQYVDDGTPWINNFCTGTQQVTHGNYDGNLTHTDLGCFNPAAGTWNVAQSLSTGVLITGGTRVLTGNVPVYLVFYGDLSAYQQQTFVDLVNGLSGTPYGMILSGYGSTEGPATGTFHVAQAVNDPASTDLTTSRSAYQTALQNHLNGAKGFAKFPVDTNAVYMVISAPTLHTWDETRDCGHHDLMFYNGNNLVTANIAGSTMIPWFTNGCGYFFDPAHPSSDLPPNGDEFVDNAASTVVHELFEAITDPDLGFTGGLGWVAPQLGGNPEIADLCGDHYGHSINHNQPTDDAYNVSLPSVGRHFLIQEMWVNLWGIGLGVCGVQIPTPPIHFIPLQK